jgi:hypothetical protein
MIVHERSDQSRRLTDPIEAWDRRRPSRPPLIPRARQRRYLPTDFQTSAFVCGVSDVCTLI